LKRDVRNLEPSSNQRAESEHPSGYALLDLDWLAPVKLNLGDVPA
jgi:hypothetical protein